MALLRGAILTIFLLQLLNKVLFCSGNPVNSSRSHQTDVDCYAEEKVMWWDGNCYSLLEQGPCEDGHWLQLSSSSTTIQVECVARPCQGKEEEEEEAVWLQKECRCVQEHREVCAEGEVLVWSPRGEGLCGCLEDHEEGEDGVCYQVGTRGPCSEGQLWEREQGGDGVACVQQGLVAPRIYDLIPNNKRRRRRRRADMRTCWVDSRGRCRKRRRFRQVRGRQGRKLEHEQPQLKFQDWLQSFQNQSSSSRECKVTCEGDKLHWGNRECHELVTQGPCSNGSWLVLHNREEDHHTCITEALVGHDRAVMRCEVNRCGGGKIWWPETCSCVERCDRSVCGVGDMLAIGPYGEGVCTQAENNHFCLKILDLIPTNEEQPVRRMCHVDENGVCRRVLKIRGLRRRNGFEDFVDWLSEFKQRTKLNQNGECII